ncbi:pol polyprotein [Pseudoloma neurophilia]|uniref:Pol polyprotein n=1 Tax=Pseudoloma neurophilia TaxID=146866 RepID=A0A0R0M7K4_9MICR|nr:pol polyprotein [Pseudoloma neurophilia]
MEKYSVKHIRSQIYNPKENAKSEKINKSINEIMRIVRYKFPKRDIISLIHNRLNFVYNRSIDCSPHMLHYRENPLNPNQSIDHHITEKANTISQKISQYDKTKFNSNKKNCQFEIGDFIYVKTPRVKKRDYLFDGPFEIHQLDRRNNGLKILLHNNKYQWINANNAFQLGGHNVVNQHNLSQNK